MADVIVSHPTELAIAIKYNPQSKPAPIAVAVGAVVIAQKTRRKELEHGIPFAEVLRCVFQLQGKSIPQAQQAA
ncbi:EscU/YscU/HrcU family type III secretion system export apparatus switch protein [Neorhodopirellula pilleata]|uniref:Flagellar biosynthetic protein FlhB n=1 Tax=Neorhodopirellula pilleata TaxID=2714738 RepID=A0A5C6AQ09_9BACT|nr:EscU/YscU/HrcU family type III secretion system export apparatus switch protein [Neorhodopirellula pilleata]TWU02035.1 Flagellar biosynthetic protein FlhB [Neorhodopirellula pilleata]